MVDEDTGRTQSSVVVLKDDTTSFTLAQYRYPPPSSGPPTAPKLDLLLEPPPSAPTLPTLVYKFVASTTPTITYPLVEAPVTVTGTVRGAPSEAVPATLVFDSASVTAVGAPSTGPTLRYRKRIDTDPTGAYSVVLPAGTYRVSVTPHARLSSDGVAEPSTTGTPSACARRTARSRA